MCHSAIAQNRARTSSSNLKDRLWLGKAAPEPERCRRDLRSPKSFELARIGLTL
jgi:hypothetical protein